MGQEIHYCSVCGVRLRSADFDRGEAVRSDAAPYCRACAAGAGLSPEPSRAAKERNTTRRIAVAGPTSTARIPVATPRRGIEAVSNSQYAALGIRACVDAGILIPKDVFVRAAQAYALAQLQPTSTTVPSGLAPGRKPRGWCYDSPCACPLHRPYGTTTAGAVGSLAIYDHASGSASLNRLDGINSKKFASDLWSRSRKNMTRNAQAN